MNTQVNLGRRASKEGKELRETIDLILAMPQASKMYWIKALYTQCKIEASTAGRLLVKEGLI